MALNFSIKIQSEIDESKNFRVEQAEIKYISAEDGLMLKSVYDTDDNGIVDNAEKLGGKSASEFAAAVHSHEIADVNGLQAALDGKINTTYTLSITGNAIVLTPSSGDAQQITIPIATASALGLVKIGTGLAIAADGTISNAYSMSYADGVLDIYGP